jgi:hypothetical protein
LSCLGLSLSFFRLVFSCHDLVFAYKFLVFTLQVSCLCLARFLVVALFLPTSLLSRPCLCLARLLSFFLISFHKTTSVSSVSGRREQEHIRLDGI